MRDEAAAAKVVDFVKLLKNPKGGKVNQRPYIDWLPWQTKFFGDVFGTFNPDGTRQ